MKYDLEKIKFKILNTVLVTENGCWEWQGQKSREGYGRFRVRGQSLAHRISYCLFKGPLLSSKMFVCHKCDNPPCINPSHLFLGSQKDNMKDCAQKKRTKNQMMNITHCKHGHEFNDENTYYSKQGRACKPCRRIKHQMYYRRGIKK